MTLTSRAPGASGAGFEGEISEFSLTDVIQLGVNSRFSGCITIEHGDERGQIFLRDMQVLHAEVGHLIGEEAFHEILSWSEGRFVLHSNLTTTRTTIQKDWQPLVMDACRRIDERRAAAQPYAAAHAEPARPHSAKSVVQEMGRIPGVVCAVAERADGARVQHDSYEAETLCGQSQYVAMVASQLGALFGATELHSATLQASRRHLLLFKTKTHVLNALADGAHDVGAVEAEIRKLLRGPK
jgi:Domain of unknown function (DUF4388)